MKEDCFVSLSLGPRLLLELDGDGANVMFYDLEKHSQDAY